LRRDAVALPLFGGPWCQRVGLSMTHRRRKFINTGSTGEAFGILSDSSRFTRGGKSRARRLCKPAG